MQFIRSFIAFILGRGGMAYGSGTATSSRLGIRARVRGVCHMPARSVSTVDKELHSYPNLFKTKPLSNGRRHEPAPTTTQRPNQPQKIRIGYT